MCVDGFRISLSDNSASKVMFLIFSHLSTPTFVIDFEKVQQNVT